MWLINRMAGSEVRRTVEANPMKQWKNSVILALDSIDLKLLLPVFCLTLPDWKCRYRGGCKSFRCSTNGASRSRGCADTPLPPTLHHNSTTGRTPGLQYQREKLFRLGRRISNSDCPLLSGSVHNCILWPANLIGGLKVMLA